MHFNSFYDLIRKKNFFKFLENFVSLLFIDIVYFSIYILEISCLFYSVLNAFVLETTKKSVSFKFSAFQEALLKPGNNCLVAMRKTKTKTKSLTRNKYL